MKLGERCYKRKTRVKVTQRKAKTICCVKKETFQRKPYLGLTGNQW